VRTPILVLLLAATLSGQIVERGFHLTARPWQALNTSRGHYLDVIEGVVRFSIKHQNDQGAIIDPYLKREHQYATPYFAFAAITLVHEGRAPDLLPNAVRAMEHATKCFAGGRDAIPDKHGEFFIPVLTGALPVFKGHVPESKLAAWTDRLRTPRERITGTNFNNWETYPMKGEWMRVLAGLAPREAAIDYIETAWRERQQKRIAAPPFFLYHDLTSNPDTLNVEAVGRGNLLGLIHLGYDGPAAPAIRQAVETATRNTLYLHDPTGQAPTNGRTDDHVWVDIGYALAFEVMAVRTQKTDPWLAGQFRRAATLAFQNVQRWRRPDGSFSVTKNWFDPALRVGYQLASQYSNYNGSFMYHLAEIFHVRAADVAEQPAPAEIGGYAFQLDDQFATAFANAGGMQVHFNLREQPSETHGNWWTPLGVVRIARPGWDTRLGPSDGGLTKDGRVSLIPEGATGPAEWSAEFVSPLLIRCSVKYANGAEHRFVITPDGVLAASDRPVMLPVLENDGRPLRVAATDRIVTTSYGAGSDQQAFLAIEGAVTKSGKSLRSTYGDLQPYIATGPVFIYPRNPAEPTADAVLKSFRRTNNGFTSVLGRVEGNLYIGRTSAGGRGTAIDLNGDGKPELTFDRECSFVLQLRNGMPTAIEADGKVIATQRGRRIQLTAHTVHRF
jgi:hypothetical protein